MVVDAAAGRNHQTEPSDLTMGRQYECVLGA